MRVVEPNNFTPKVSKKRKNKNAYLGIVAALIILVTFVAGWMYFHKKRTAVSSNNSVSTIHNQASSSTLAAVSSDTTQKPVKQFTGEEFKNLYHSIAYPNTQKITDPIPITGNITADNEIRKLAQNRGYITTSIPVQSIDKIAGFEESDNLLQPLAYKSWLDLKSAAQNAKIPLVIFSAYRSPEYQRNLFMSRLLATGVTVNQIALGQGDSQIETTLYKTAVPGYSRHHTGYTVDFWCEDGSSVFANSICFNWLNKNNYQNVKEKGWIPSYPSGANEQGPEPEPWEYVWVGRDTLT